MTRDPRRRERSVTNFLILICQHDGCDASFRVRKGDLPDKCPDCREVAKWRVALAGEYTHSDIQFLRSIRIAPFAPGEEWTP